MDKCARGLLVVGYGNTLRRDDGVGLKVAEAVAAFNLPGVRITGERVDYSVYSVRGD